MQCMGRRRVLSISTFIRFQFNPTKKRYSLVRDTASKCFTVSHSPLLFLVLPLVPSYLFAPWHRTLLYTMCPFIPPIFTSQRYLVCTNFMGIGRNQKEKENTYIDCTHREIIGIAGFMRGE